MTVDPEKERRDRACNPAAFDESEEVLIRYFAFTHEAEVLMHALADAVQKGRITADEARQKFEPYRELASSIYAPVETEEYGNGFPAGVDYLWTGRGAGNIGILVGCR